jgi:hypothetical protein
MTDRDPYAILGERLIAAAERQAGNQRAAMGRRSWLSHRLNAALVAAGLVLGGGAVAVAATGVLSGAPVKPEMPLSPVAGNGLPVSGAAGHLLLTTSDPAGGLPWGMRVFDTTRGQVCMQVGRVQDGQLGVLGLDSAFNNDGRFHALPTDALPPGYGGSASTSECQPAGQTVIVEEANADRSAERLLPEDAETPKAPKHPPTRDMRAISYGLLGPNAVSVTYRDRAGLQTTPVAGPEGAFLIVEPAGYIKNSSLVGESVLGHADARSVTVMPPPRVAASAIVSAATFRFGTKLCSEGTGAPVAERCPEQRASVPEGWFSPTHSLHAPIQLTLLRQSTSACKAAFLLTPCYKGLVEFTAPYSVTTAATDYLIQGSSGGCTIGGRPETGWSLEHDVRGGEKVRTLSLGLFVFAPSCAASESFRVTYQNTQGPSAASPHESVILGSVRFSEATLPNGAPVARQNSSTSG